MDNLNNKTDLAGTDDICFCFKNIGLGGVSCSINHHKHKTKHTPSGESLRPIVS